MFQTKRKVPLLILVLFLAMNTSACQNRSSDTPTTSMVNIARSARLSQTTAIEISQFDERLTHTPRPSMSQFYASRIKIEDKAIIDQFVSVLDQELQVGMVPACIAEFELYFYLKDGTIAQFDYMCHNEDPYFIGGNLSDNSFKLGGEVRLPDHFKELLDEQLKLAPEFTSTP